MDPSDWLGGVVDFVIMSARSYWWTLLLLTALGVLALYLTAQ